MGQGRALYFSSQTDSLTSRCRLFISRRFGSDPRNLQIKKKLSSITRLEVLQFQIQILELLLCSITCLTHFDYWKALHSIIQDIFVLRSRLQVAHCFIDKSNTYYTGGLFAKLFRSDIPVRCLETVGCPNHPQAPPVWCSLHMQGRKLFPASSSRLLRIYFTVKNITLRVLLIFLIEIQEKKYS